MSEHPDHARVLIVEDDEAWRGELASFLQDEGFEAYGVSCGEEALRELEARAFHLVITDVYLPDMRGPDVLRRIREVRPDIPAVAMTGAMEVEGPELMEAFHDLGAYDLLPKSVEPETLLAAIHAAMVAGGAGGRIMIGDLREGAKRLERQGLWESAAVMLQRSGQDSLLRGNIEDGMEALRKAAVLYRRAGELDKARVAEWTYKEYERPQIPHRLSRGGGRAIGLVTAGGDCAGLNAAVRAVVKAAARIGNMCVIGFEDGFAGLIDNRSRILVKEDVVGVIGTGGTMLGGSNIANPLRHPIERDGTLEFHDMTDRVLANVEAHDLEGLICVGGEGTMHICVGLQERGLNVIGIPKTIDNDLWGTETTIGFDTAVEAATRAIDRIRTTAASHHRVMVVEVMGRYAGWLALASGLATGADVILIPEIDYDLDQVCQAIRERQAWGRTFTLVVLAEAAKPVGGAMVTRMTVKASYDAARLGGVGEALRRQIEGQTGIETRVVVLGHVVRGGQPTAFDRNLATRLGCEAVRLAGKRDYGKMAALRDSDIVGVPIEDVVAQGGPRTVPLDCSLIRSALATGVFLGQDLDESPSTEEVT